MRPLLCAILLLWLILWGTLGMQARPGFEVQTSMRMYDRFCVQAAGGYYGLILFAFRPPGSGSRVVEIHVRWGSHSFSFPFYSPTAAGIMAAPLALGVWLISSSGRVRPPCINHQLTIALHSTRR